MTGDVAAALVAPAGTTRLAETPVVLEWIGSTLVSACADGTLAVDGIPASAYSTSSAAVVALDWGPRWEMASIDHRGRVRVGASVQELGGWGRRLWFCGMDRLVAVTSEGVHSGPIGCLRRVSTGLGAVTEACLLPGCSMAVGTTEGWVFVDPEPGSEEHRRAGPTVSAFALSPSGDLLAVGDASGSAHVVRLDFGEGLAIDGYREPVRLVCWAGRHLVVVDGSRVTAWPVSVVGQVTADAPTCLLPAGGRVTALASPATKAVVAAGDAQGCLRLLSPDAPAAPLAEIHLHSRIVRLAWSGDGARLAAGCVDGSLHRYDVLLV